MVEILEAIWFNNGEEVAWVDPVIRVDVGEGPLDVVVFNGCDYYLRGDGYVPKDVDDFIVRVSKTHNEEDE